MDEARGAEVRSLPVCKACLKLGPPLSLWTFGFYSYHWHLVERGSMYCQAAYYAKQSPQQRINQVHLLELQGEKP